LLAVRRPGETIEGSSVGSDATGSTTAHGHNVNVTGKKPGTLHIGNRRSIGGENWIGDVQIGLGDQCLPLSVLDRQEQDAGARVLKRHSIRHDQVLTVERPVDAPPKRVVLAIRLSDFSFGSTQGRNEVISAFIRWSVSKEGDIPAIG